MKPSSTIAVLFTAAFTSSAYADPLVFEAQDIMYAMSVDVGTPDGDAGKRTLAGLEAVLGSPHGNVSTDVVEQLHQTFVAAHQAPVPVTWEYKSAEIEISGYNEQIFQGLNTLADMKASGFNTVTFNFHCDRGQSIDESAPEYYPWERHLGCELGFNILDGSSQEALKVYIAEAKKLGLRVNLKPMFLDLTSEGQRFGYKYGEVSVEKFLYGDAPNWDGYIPRILRIAALAEKLGVEYLTVGTEFGNLNPKMMHSEDWNQIISDVRKVYSGKLMYSHNFGGDGTVKELKKMAEFVKLIDILGINYFPPLVMDGKKFYTVEQAANGIAGYSNDGEVLTEYLSDLAKESSAKIVMSEVSFPTWRGNINWMFRHTCDGDNSGKSGWEFTKGPLSPKQPSTAASLVLAAAWYDVFAKQPWVHGASHVFWYSTWVDSDNATDFVQSIGIKECGKTLYENKHLMEIISSYYK